MSKPTADIHTIEQVEKGHAEHVEDTDSLKQRDLDVDYDAQEDQPRVGIRKLLRRNPSYEFIRDVAKKDQEELDPVQVRRVSLSPRLEVNADVQLEKKLFWLIVPALCMDYIFYYVDKT